MKKWGSILLSSMLLSSSLATGVYAETNEAKQIKATSDVLQTELNDIDNHWAKDAISQWVNRGVIQGDKNHNFAPSREITRAEWVALVNRIFQYQEIENSSFSDVNPSSWYANEIATAIASGYVKGYADGTFHPTANLTREEAAATLSRIFNLQGSSNTSFVDDKNLQQWSREAVSGAAEKRIILGYQDGRFLPGKAITRAEAVSILDRAFNLYGNWYGEAGTYGGSEQVIKTIKENVIISGSGVTLQNTIIEGDLIIGKDVGSGEVYLNNVEVKGNTYVYGGGENSIHLADSVLHNITVHKLDGRVRLAAEGKTSVEELVIQTGANIDSSKGVMFHKIILSEDLPDETLVSLKGDFEKVSVMAKNINMLIPNGLIKDLEFSTSSVGTSLNMGKDSKVSSALFNAAVRVSGVGTIDEATVNVSGISLEKAPNQVKLGNGVPKDTMLQVGGVVQSVSSLERVPVIPSPSNGSNSSGGSSGTGGSQPVVPVNPGSEESPSPGVIAGEEYGARDDGNMYWLGIEGTMVTAGDPVYVYSPRSGYAYITLEHVTSHDSIALEEAIKAGDALKFPIKANERTAIPTTLLKEYGQIGIFVIDQKGKDTFTNYISILDGPSHALVQKDIFIGLTWNDNREEYRITFNRSIKANVLNLKDNVLVSTNSDIPEFELLDEEDEVEISNDTLIIRTKKSLGQNTYFRLLEGAISTTDDEYKNELFTSRKISSITRATFIDYPNSEFASFPVGSIIRFNVNYGGHTAYLVKQDIQSNYEQYEQQVSDGDGLKLNIPEDGTNQTYEFDTKNLPPGDYILDVIGGYILSIQLTGN